MEETLTGLVSEYGYPAVGLLIFIENVFPPIPSEAVLLFGGFMTTEAEMSILLMSLFATIGSLLGAVALYLLGALLGRERLKLILSGRIVRLIHLSPASVDKADEWFGRYGKKAVLICRCIPIVRSLISIPAGMSGMRFLPFIALTAIGSAVWNTVLISIGALVGNAWEKFVGYFGIYTAIAAAAIVLTAVVIIICRWRRKSKD